MSNMKLPTSHREWAEQIGERLAALRGKHRYELHQVARAVGYAHGGSVAKLENGENLPSLDKAAQLAIFFDCSLDFILLGVGWGGVRVMKIDEVMATETPLRTPKPPAPSIHFSLLPLPPQPEFKMPKMKKNIVVKQTDPASGKLKTTKAVAKPAAKRNRSKKNMDYDMKLLE